MWYNETKGRLCSRGKIRFRCYGNTLVSRNLRRNNNKQTWDFHSKTKMGVKYSPSLYWPKCWWTYKNFECLHHLIYCPVIIQGCLGGLDGWVDKNTGQSRDITYFTSRVGLSSASYDPTSTPSLTHPKDTATTWYKVTTSVWNIHSERDRITESVCRLGKSHETLLNQ